MAKKTAKRASKPAKSAKKAAKMSKAARDARSNRAFTKKFTAQADREAMGDAEYTRSGT